MRVAVSSSFRLQHIADHDGAALQAELQRGRTADAATAAEDDHHAVAEAQRARVRDFTIHVGHAHSSFGVGGGAGQTGTGGMQLGDPIGVHAEDVAQHLVGVLARARADDD